MDLIGNVLIGCECRGFTNPKTGAPSGCRVVFIKSWRANMRHLEKSQGVPSLVGFIVVICFCLLWNLLVIKPIWMEAVGLFLGVEQSPLC